MSAYFSRHVSGVGTLKSGVDRVDGVYLSMSNSVAYKTPARFKTM